MSDPRNPFAALPSADPADAAALEARHEVILGLLGAYADGELPAETVAQLDAHFVSCTRCRRELAVHHAVRERLAAEPPAAASPALRARVAAAVAAAPPPTVHVAPAAARRPARHRRLAGVVGLVGLLAAGAAVAARPWRADEPTTERLRPLAGAVATDALLGAVLDDYRRVVARDLPGRARDVDAVRAAVPFPVEPLGGDGLRLLAAWTTDLRGEQAAVLAYRWEDRVVVQYVVAEAHFFRSPAVRAGVAAGHVLSAGDGPVAMLAWPLPSAGSVLVADAPAARLAAIRELWRVAERPVGGAQ
jgi:anti-sigma factor RsiW